MQIYPIYLIYHSKFARDKYFINNYKYFYMNFLFSKIAIIIIITI